MTTAEQETDAQRARRLLLAVELDQDELACRILEAQVGMQRPPGMKATEALETQTPDIRLQVRRAAAGRDRLSAREIQLGFIGFVTPATVKRAAEALARAVDGLHDARAEGAALGRALAAQLRAKETATEQIHRAAEMDLELALLQLAASGDEPLAEVADSALRALRDQQQ